MSEFAHDAGFNTNHRLKDALLQHRTLSREGLSERLFGLLFSGLVYPQIWEDPDVDMAAMELGAGHRMVTIASGGCNMLAYLSRHPARIDVVDLNPHHVALNRLKLAAFRFLPTHGDVVRQFGMENIASNSRAYDTFIAPKLDVATRRYWNGRTNAFGRRRIAVEDHHMRSEGGEHQGRRAADAATATGDEDPLFIEPEHRFGGFCMRHVTLPGKGALSRRSCRRRGRSWRRSFPPRRFRGFGNPRKDRWHCRRP